MIAVFNIVISVVRNNVKAQFCHRHIYNSIIYTEHQRLLLGIVTAIKNKAYYQVVYISLLIIRWSILQLKNLGGSALAVIYCLIIIIFKTILHQSIEKFCICF